MKILILFSQFFVSIISNSQDNLKMLNNGMKLSEYIEKYFYSSSSQDSCYTGIHYITISFERADLPIIQFSGNINPLYKTRIETLLLQKIWNDAFIKDSKKKDRVIIQPIFLDISKNCIYDTMNLSADSSLKNISKERIYEVSTSLLVKQRIELIESYKNLFSTKKSKTNTYLLLSPCYISARTPKEKIIM